MNPSSESLTRPPRLKAGDTIGIVAPAGVFDRQIFNQGLSTLESMGYRTQVPDEVYSRNDYLAGSDELRAQLVNALFKDPNIQAIICARGGFGSLRMLPLVDYETIRNHPKIFIGFSDISALLTAITHRSDLVTFHGPMVTTLATAPEPTRSALTAAVASDISLEIAPTSGVVIRPGRAEGRITGGNLATLCHLMGTPFHAHFKNHILLLEDRGEARYRIDRMLSQMKLANCFDGIAGLILGSFEECGDRAGIYRIFDELFHDSHIPILAGFDIGHGHRNLTLPLGMTAVLDADQQILSFSQAATV